MSLNDSTRMQYQVIDLFCGAGGFSLGLSRSGLRILGAIDSWPIAVKTYRSNFRHPCMLGKIEDCSASTFYDLVGNDRLSVDLLVGGPPCQGFSIQRIGSDHDLRNSLVIEFARIARELSPKLFIMENVPGLIGKRGKPLLERFLESVEKAGFATSVLKVSAVGAERGSAHRNRVEKQEDRYDNSGREIVVVNTKTGKVKLRGNPNEAAKRFWKAVEMMHPGYKKRGE